MTPKTVYILGAGSSMSHSGNIFPDIHSVLAKAAEQEVTVKENGDLKPQYMDLSSYLNTTFNEDLSSTNSNLDFERVYTFVEIESEKNSGIFDPFRRQLKEIISQVFVKLNNEFSSSIEDVKDTEYWRFASDLQNRDTVITFNWDFLLDDIFGRADWISTYEQNQSKKDDREEDGDRIEGHTQYSDFIQFCYGMESRFPFHIADRPGAFLKLHGSADWKICINSYCPKYNLPLPTLNPSEYIGCFACLEPCETLLVPPTLNKQISQIPLIRILWNIAAKELEIAGKVVIWGYSLPPTDFMAEWLLRKMLNNKKLEEIVIINPQPKHVGRIREIFDNSILTNKIKEFEKYSDYLEK